MDATIFQYAIEALLTLLSPTHFLYLFMGVTIGLTIGLIPGLGGIAGMAIIMPFLFGMDPGLALAMMIGLSSTTSTSDTFMSVLVGVPGGSSAQATVLDGFPLARQGMAARALSAAFISSMLGGIFGALLLSIAFVLAKPVLLAVGFGEQLMLVVFALTLVGMLTGPSMAKGLASCCIGLLLGTIGASQATAEYRFTFDTIYLSDGIPLVVVALGIFAFPEIIDVLRKHARISEAGALGGGWMQGIRDVLRHWWIVLRCSFIGAIVGALPGLGGSVIDWIAYGHVVQTSKDKSRFGKGDIRGVIGPESAANAKEGGALIPTLFFGIPGSGTMALLLGGLVVIGITPGRPMVTSHMDLVFLIIWSIALANILGTAISVLLAKPISHVTVIPFARVAPFLLVMVFLSAYQATREWGDLITLVAIGVLGIFMKRLGWSRAALLIGFVLAPRLEAALYRSVQIYGWDLFLRPISVVIMVLAAISLIYAWRNRAHSVSDAERGEYEASLGTLGVQIGFTLIVMAVGVWFIATLLQLRFLAWVFPVSVCALMLAFCAWMVFGMIRRAPWPGLITDTEAGGDGSTPGSFRLLGWILVLPALSYLIGFIYAAPLYVLGFLRSKARLGWIGALSGAVVILLIEIVLANVLLLQFPEGYLQDLLPASRFIYRLW
ncbi:tripartite tricarboxylate transporter permease [Paracoccus onubensis]|uniref:tripartite tricarboxylate transporter permease n=1 Tax=Paracoccus onubensis TaxID=1675788 RepID=UPI002730E947|nr:tripartite tricarboxylate transporter permease [Paracoccus onubensis]MDP0926647.1 tripartite tricarboxylate transporter permease [Paracoccus onubensis]